MSARKKTWGKMGATIGTDLTPELIIAIAFTQCVMVLRAGKRLTRRISQANKFSKTVQASIPVWSTPHGFFINMGAVYFRFDRCLNGTFTTVVVADVDMMEQLCQHHLLPLGVS